MQGFTARPVSYVLKIHESISYTTRPVDDVLKRSENISYATRPMFLKEVKIFLALKNTEVTAVGYAR